MNPADSSRRETERGGGKTLPQKEPCSRGVSFTDRSYVDGNGGNISVRLGERYILCTPTLIRPCDLEG